MTASITEPANSIEGSDPYTCWLSFSITPVQSFIEAARTLRDLSVGSALLVTLTAEAIRAGQQAGGKLLYPVLQAARDGRETWHGIPNQFVITCLPDQEAEIAKAMLDAACSAWTKLAVEVKAELDRLWKPGWDAGWQEQIDRFWDIRVAAVDRAETMEGTSDTLTGQGADPTRHHWSLLTARTSAGKQVRWFRGDHGQARQKCTLFGELEQMGPAGGVADTRSWWRNCAAGTRIGAARIGANERLCAVSLVKRFASCVPAARELVGPLHACAASMPDTQEIAAAGWRAQYSGVLQSELASLDAAITAFHQALGTDASWISETRDWYLLSDQLRNSAEAWESLLGEVPAANRVKISAAAGPALDTLIAARKKLDRARRDAAVPPAPRYYAILELDGDHMGKWLSGEMPAGTAITTAHFQNMSGLLRNYAQSIKQTVENAHGQLIYAGGDDCLAVLPRDSALACAQELRKNFPQFAPGVESSTASAGIVVCHVSHNLRDALREARLSIESAKRRGRDSLAIRILKRSGGDIGVCLPWGELQALQKLTEAFIRGGSARWAGRVAELEGSIADDASGTQIGLLIKAFLQRTASGSGVEDAAMELWDVVHRATADQNRELRTNDPGSCYPCYDDGAQSWERGFWSMALGAFLEAIGSASFLAREGE